MSYKFYLDNHYLEILPTNYVVKSKIIAMQKAIY